jgi:hypothetical protein
MSKVGNIAYTYSNVASSNRLTEEVVTDLNNATPCRIFTMTSGYGSTDGNKPTTGWVTGLTLQFNQDGAYRRQLAYSDDFFVRDENNGSWGDWRRILTSTNFYDYALPITGGTVNGAVTINHSDNTPLVINQNYGTVSNPRGVVVMNSTLSNSNLYISHLFGKEASMHNSAWVGFYLDSAGSNNNRLSMGLYGVDNILNILGSGNVAIGGTTASEKLHVYGRGRFMMFKNGNSSSIIPEVTALTISTNEASYSGYNTGIGFNALGDYGSLTYKDHIHAWIGLGGATTTEEAECYPLVFATNGSITTGTAPIERMRITPDGQVIVTGDTLLGGINLQHTDEINRYGGNLYIQQRNSDGTGHVVMCYNGGNVGIGLASPSEKLHVNGNCKANDFQTTSDNRLKDFVSDIDLDFEALKLIPKKYYYWKDKSMGEDLQIGTSAQELAKIYPTCVSYDEVSDRYSVNYQKLSIVALAAIDKLHERVSELESKLND